MPVARRHALARTHTNFRLGDATLLIHRPHIRKVTHCDIDVYKRQPLYYNINTSLYSADSNIRAYINMKWSILYKTTKWCEPDDIAALRHLNILVSRRMRPYLFDFLSAILRDFLCFSSISSSLKSDTVDPGKITMCVLLAIHVYTPLKVRLGTSEWELCY